MVCEVKCACHDVLVGVPGGPDVLASWPRCVVTTASLLEAKEMERSTLLVTCLGSEDDRRYTVKEKVMRLRRTHGSNEKLGLFSL